MKRQATELLSEPQIEQQATAQVESPWLPDEVLLTIFVLLKRGDLGACKKVSQTWTRVANHPSLNWVLAVQFSVRQFEMELEVENAVKKIKDLHKVGKLQFRHFTPQLEPGQEMINYNYRYRSRSKVQVLSDKEEVLGSIYPIIDHHGEFRPPEFTNDLLWKEEYIRFVFLDQKPLTQPRWKINFTPVLSADGDQILSWSMEMEMHTLRFEKAALAVLGSKSKSKGLSKTVPSDEHFSDLETELIFLCVKLNTNRFLQRVMKSATTNPFIPDASFDKLKQPKEVTPTLFEYQLDAVSWMSYVENNVSAETEIKFGRLSSWGACQTDVLFDLEHKQMHLPSSIDKFTDSFQIKGGVIADEMGLGKTMEMISLSLANKPTPEYMKNVGKFVNGLYYSRATFVHCPNHLARQWKEEVQKNTTATVAVITTINEFKTYSMNDLCTKFDFVCCSFQFLIQNKNYKDFGETTNQKRLSNYHWYRLILDEGHEIIDGLDKTKPWYQKQVEVPINSFESEFRWYCTGTPFPSEAIILGCMHYLIPGVKWKDLFLGTENGVINQNMRYQRQTPRSYESWVIFDIILNNFYWRNTKESVKKDEYNLPPYSEDLVLCDFNEVEKSLYDDALDNIAEKLEVCSNSIRCGFDLESCRASRMQQRTYELQSYTEQVTNYTNYVDAYNKGERDHHALYQRFHVWGTADMVEVKRRLQENIMAKQRAEKQMKIWNACKAVPRPVPIPVEKVVKAPKKNGAAKKTKDINDMTPDEMKAELRARGRSENGARGVLFKRLNAILEKEEMEKVDSEEEMEIEEAPRYDTENMILKYGTKLTKIMQYLRKMWEEKPESKVIIFSKFSAQLERIRNLLDGEGVRSVVVAGNVARRNKAIVEFKSSCKVILLGLGSAASGTNLTEATHVMLVDPMSGTAKEIKAIESQAIARAHRRGQEKEIVIVRFMMKDTIELSNYINVYGTSKLPVDSEERKQEEASPRKAKPMLLKSHSAATMVVNAPGLKRGGSLALLVDNDFI